MTTNSLSNNAGVVAPAPVVSGVAIAIGLVAELVVPTALVSRPVGIWLGIAVMAVAIPIVVSAFRALARAHTAFDARKPTSSIVTDGAFRLSRNPTYVSLTLLHVAVALILGSIWVLLMVVPAVIAIHWGVVRREERYLEAKFGEEYRSYATKVRRWA